MRVQSGKPSNTLLILHWYNPMGNNLEIHIKFLKKSFLE